MSTEDSAAIVKVEIKEEEVNASSEEKGTPHVEPQRKRVRSANFTAEDMNVLLNIISQFKHIIEDKTTNAATWKEKEKAWEKVSTTFNSISPSGYIRTAEMLKKAFENKKKTIRKDMAKEKSVLRRSTGIDDDVPVDPNRDLTISIMNRDALFGTENQIYCDIENSQECIDPIEFIDDNDDMLENGNKCEESVKIAKTREGSTSGGKCCKNTQRDSQDLIASCSSGNSQIRRRPGIIPTNSTNLSEKYSKLADLKIEYVKMQILEQKEDREIKRKESELRQKSLQLDIKLKEAQLHNLLDNQIKCYQYN